ncbi:MAG: hypothetical protein H0T89_35265 [Deltaproteobacteria bacterium]|nr:hypothetical protein [Deltaproteobacteria bacterium]MDQ3299952.1 hypothetical protein [Myxococcota bacterium]
MTKRLLILAIILGASACASRAPRSTLPVRYTCGDTAVVRTGSKLAVDAGEVGVASLGWQDDHGDHFVTWPRVPTDGEAVEYVIPSDHRMDAIEKLYDATHGYSSSDWRLVRKRVCRAEGGYSDALTRWMGGATLDQVAKDLALRDRDDARRLVRKALVSLQKQYLRDR